MNHNQMPHLTCVIAMVLLTASSAAQAAQQAEFFIAPQPAGDATGRGQAHPGALHDLRLWQQVQQALEHGPVTVTLLDGVYELLPNILLRDLGHDTHTLTLQGQSERGAVLMKHPDDPHERPNLFVIQNCRNLLVRFLNFTGDGRIAYAFNIRGGSRDILVDRCTWIDLAGAHFGAAGTAGTGTTRIVFRNCTFERIGYGAHSHAIYNAYGPTHIHVIDCTFQDCAGDYVRFRDRTDWCIVAGNTFVSTGQYRNAAYPCVSVPLFNSRGPDHEQGPRYETFGTHFLIYDNQFIYPEGETDGHSFAILFYHKGFDPPGRRHLLTQEEATLLRNGPAEARKALLWENCRIDTRRVRVFNNTFINATMKAAFGSWGGYGSPTPQWQGYVDIFDLLNLDPITHEEKAAFGLPQAKQ